MNRISFQDTHVYPGCLAVFFFKIIDENTTLPVVAEFSDGIATEAEAEQVNAEEVIVRVDSYRTAHGTNIPEKTWRKQCSDDYREMLRLTLILIELTFSYTILTCLCFIIPFIYCVLTVFFYNQTVCYFI